MGFFTNSYTEKESKLELALEGIVEQDEIKYCYEACGKQKNEKKELLLYVLPTIQIDNLTHGLFLINEELVEAPIGIMHKRSFFSIDYYLLNGNGLIYLNGNSHQNENNSANTSNSRFSNFIDVKDLFTNLLHSQSNSYKPDDNIIFYLL